MSAPGPHDANGNTADFIDSLVLAILAAIVASQAMITSNFQLLAQVMRRSYFPHIKVVHTSKRFHEQVYMPMANWLLMIGTVVVTAVYNNVCLPLYYLDQVPLVTRLADEDPARPPPSAMHMACASSS